MTLDSSYSYLVTKLHGLPHDGLVDVGEPPGAVGAGVLLGPVIPTTLGIGLSFHW